MFIFNFLNDQLLKMQWLSDLVKLLVEKVFGLDISARLGGSIHFFIYDVIKIFILLSVLIFAISYIQSYFPPRADKEDPWGSTTVLVLILSGHCSVPSRHSAPARPIPLFIGFTNAGLPINVTFSFLISSPLVDLASVLLLASIFNWKIAICLCRRRCRPCSAQRHDYR